MNERELWRMAEQQRELARLAEQFRGPVEAARRLLDNAEAVARMVAPLAERRTELEQIFATADLVQRTFVQSPGVAAAAAALRDSAELQRQIAAASEPIRAAFLAERAREAFLRSAAPPSRQEIDRVANLIRQEWAKFPVLDEAAYQALFTAAAAAAEAAGSTHDVVPGDPEETTARFLARAVRLPAKARMALLKGLLEGALALIDAAQRLASNPSATAAALAAMEVAVGIIFIAIVLASFGDD